MAAGAAAMGLKCRIVTPDEINEISPLVRTNDLIGGLYVEEDGVANPFEICLALGNIAMENGVSLVENW